MVTTDLPSTLAADDGSDPAPDEEERGPTRRCAVSRERLPKEAMIRFVVAPDGAVVADLGARLPGRGIWLSARGDVIEAAGRRGGFARAARRAVRVPEDLAARLPVALAERIAETLGLARRAGQAVAGFERAKAWLATGRAALVVQASDGSAEERARFVGGATVDVVAPLDAARLGRIFGRDRAVHVAVASGQLAERLRCDAARLTGVSGDATMAGPKADTATA